MPAPSTARREPNEAPAGRTALRGIRSARARSASATIGTPSATAPFSAIPHEIAWTPSGSTRRTIRARPAMLPSANPAAAVT